MLPCLTVRLLRKLILNFLMKFKRALNRLL
nr:MAG TPA: hypothetical protein [Caudoviricetes sp.]DAI58387.1 MAG TPA: hypothetical protein [Crassvirales sp.]DAR45673.1 MAG TPA: hypothetical protein [Bacteriophage sp.]DAX21773.1 MAG TPA: hypothetical protein [Caudoviricetes sp.]